MATSSPVNAAKVKEGDKLIAEAEKCLKTGWLKWNPDLDGAAHAFDKAGLCYRNAKALSQARKAYERAADTYYKSHLLFNAGKSLEQVATICKEQEKLEESAQYLERASGMYHESGHADTAGQVLRKAAKLVETTAPRRAAQYYLSTADLHEAEEKYRDAASAVRYGVSMYCRARDFDDLLGALYKLKNLFELTNQYKNLYEVAAIEVIVHLHRGDLAAASDSYTNASMGMSGFPGSDAALVLDSLLTAYREGETEDLYKACDSVLFRTMDNEVAKLARDLKSRVAPSVMSGAAPLDAGASSMAGATPLHSGDSPQSSGDVPQSSERSPPPEIDPPTDPPADDDKYSGVN